MLKNKLLAQAQADIEKSVQDRDMYDRLVKAGGKVIYSQNTFRQLTQALKASKDPVSDVAKGIVAVLQLMSHRARGTIKQGPLTQAGMAMMLDALDFLEQAGMLKVDSKVLDQATQDYLEALLPSMGLTHEKMQSMLTQIHQVSQDPAKMAAFQQSQQQGSVQ